MRFSTRPSSETGRARTLEEQAALPIVNQLEMGQPSMDAAVAGIAALAECRHAFQQVFGRAPNGSNPMRAIASDNGPVKDRPDCQIAFEVLP